MWLLNNHKKATLFRAHHPLATWVLGVVLLGCLGNRFVAEWGKTAVSAPLPIYPNTQLPIDASQDKPERIEETAVKAHPSNLGIIYAEIKNNQSNQQIQAKLPPNFLIWAFPLGP